MSGGHIRKNAKIVPAAHAARVVAEVRQSRWGAGVALAHAAAHDFSRAASVSPRTTPISARTDIAANACHLRRGDLAAGRPNEALSASSVIGLTR